ncbi:Hypothetical predicted protein [Marmota monax]|uniref:DUF1899 domain-containing protein n=1 Tax=Marmota monax TaxID=9995 RepID=A0A5E4DF50_MARMO|nr:Hypothetical predicted protein [Marmota monax]
MNRFKVSKFRHMEARLPRREAWINDIRAGTTPSCGNQIKSSCTLIAFNSDRPGMLGIMALEGQGEDKRHVAYLGCHSEQGNTGQTGFVSSVQLQQLWAQALCYVPGSLLGGLGIREVGKILDPLTG